MAALQAGGCLEEVLRDRTPVALPAPKAPSADRPATTGSAALATPAQPRGSAARLTAAVLEHDERIAYSTAELLELQRAAAAAAFAANSAALLRAALPADLRSP